MFGFLTKLFKPKGDKDVQSLQPLVDQINQHFKSYASLSDQQLRDKTAELKGRIQTYLSEILKAIDEFKAAAETARIEGDIQEQERLFGEIDKLEKQRNTALEEVLNQILPEAFAVVKETCRRLAQNGQLVVPANAYDRELNARRGYPALQGDTAIWGKTWKVTGRDLTWDMVHYDVQLMGGIVLHQGKISEMATGEGKTLVSTLPAYLNALSGYGVHVVTVNDYLARRDSEWNGPIFEFHGLRVACIDTTEPHSDERKAAYAADITFGTNSEFGFDYLRDNMTTSPEHLAQRKLHYAIIDEIDSVLIDDARTPLIISGPVPQGDRHEYLALKPRIEKLLTQQRALVNQYLAKAKELMRSEAKGSKDEAGHAVFRAYRGLPKHGALIKFLSEDGVRTALQKAEGYYLADNAKKLPEADEDLYFTIDEKNNQIELTEKGRELITKQGEDPNLFVLPDVATALAEIENNRTWTDEQRQAQKEELARNFAEKSERLHSITQLLKAYALFEKDVDYIVQDGKVQIVDENTGRVLSGRRYSDGLHQAIEAKENVKVEAATQTFATITLQNYFRMYHKLSGMTGTAETEATEFFQIYKLDVVVIPTNKPILRQDHNDLVYRTKREKYNAIIDEIVRLTEAGRPVLVGTSSVDVSELLSRMLKMRNIKHNVLNAKQHQREAEIVAEAGMPGIVTIATNMAGRGTDIKLGPGVREAGGLAIIGSERHDSRRIDRQLRGRAGRQGDPGSSQFFVSFEDDLMRLFGSERVGKIMDMLGAKEGEVIQHSMITKQITNAQRKVEENNYSMRKRTLEYDDVMNQQREVIYGRRRNALYGDRIKLDLDNMLYDFCTEIVAKYYNDKDYEGYQLDCLRFLAIDPELGVHAFDSWPQVKIADHLYDLARKRYQEKEERFAEMFYNGIKEVHTRYPNYRVLGQQFTDGTRLVTVEVLIEDILESEGRAVWSTVEKRISLSVIDELWKEHLREMDELRGAVQMAVYEQKDPLLIYKFEAFELFKKLLIEVNQQVLSLLFKLVPAQHTESERVQEPKRDDFSRTKAQHPVAQTPVVDAEEIRGQAPGGMPGGVRGGEPERQLSRRERREMERKKTKTPQR